MTATYNFIVSTGVISADTADILSDVESEWIAALGVGLDTDASLPQGTLIQTETLARTSVMKNNAELASVINPSYSYGVFLDAICSLMGISRETNIQTVVKYMLLTTVAGTSVTVPAGTQITTAAGDVFIQKESVTTSTGSARVTYYSKEYGAIPFPLSTTYGIVPGYNVIGLNSVSSDATTSVVEGVRQLSDGALKAKRNMQLYLQGLGSLGAIYARALNVDGVTSILAIENATGAAGTVNGITFSTPNGVWICAAGIFNKQDLANALWKAHMGGQPYDYGAAGQGVQVDAPLGTPVLDTASQLTYLVKMTTPVMYDMYVNITVKQNTAIASADDIKQIILNYAQGNLNGEIGFAIGVPQSAFELAGAVAAQFPGLYIKACSIAAVTAGSAAPVYPGAFTSEWVPSPWQQPQIVRGFITVQFAS